MHSPDIAEMEIKMPGATAKYFQARAAALKDSFGEKVGVVVVFNDITRLKKLESIRRDFVANVSHELRTPITAITGSVETLLDGAMDNSDDSRRFLEMIARHEDDEAVFLKTAYSSRKFTAIYLTGENHD